MSILDFLWLFPEDLECMKINLYGASLSQVHIYIK